MKPFIKKLLPPLIVGFALAGCSTFTEVTPTEGGDLDWARTIADGVIADFYDQSLVMFRVEATYLDIQGFLYGGVQHPYWRFWYNDPDILVRIVVHPDGSTTVMEDENYHSYDISFTYTSADLADWLELGRYCYRYITGREDDVCYGFEAFCGEYSSDARITLFNPTFDKLARVEINMIDGTLVSFDLY
ncbi:MAG TPA: hypothetical protein VM054_01810 [bacterium]|nr:hypothetical protein [bacterium]